MDPCILTETGSTLLPLILLGAGLLVAAVLIICRSPARTKTTLMTLLVLGLSLGAGNLPAATIHAQSADDCPPGSSTDPGSTNTDPGGTTPDPGSDSSGTVLSLTDDTGLVQIPTDLIPTTSTYIPILSNDSPPSGDPYDWTTVDLDPQTAGRQEELSLSHPQDNSYECGILRAESFGVVAAYLRYQCNDSDWNILNIPSDFTIAPFQYTVQTLGGTGAPQPATIAINTQTGSTTGTVIAVEDEFNLCVTTNPTGIDILSNDTTASGTLDPLTLDLDVNQPGIQSSVIAKSINGLDFTLTVNASGELSVSTPLGTDDYDAVQGFYTVMNTDGDTSNIAPFLVGCTPPF